MKKIFELILALITMLLFFTQSSTAQLRFDKDWTLRKDMPVFTNPKNNSVQANIYQNDKKVRLTFVLSKKSNAKSVKCQLSFDPVYFFVVGMPVLVNAKTKEKTEIDYEFKNERVIFDEVTVDKNLKYIEFGVASRKLKNLGTLTAKEKVKQARTIRRIKQQLDSWSPLAANQIIAQPTLRPIISHGGYAVDGVKKAVIWANNTKLTGKFELIDALNNVQHPAPQPVVCTGDLIETENHIWGGNNYIADFSDFKKEGLYFVRLKVNETKEISDSYVFPIKKNIYFDLAKKATKWFYYQRCGVEVPGFHKACHTEDAIIKKDGTKIDVTGGWHDAGDYGKWMWGGSMGLLGLTTFQNDFGAKLTDSLEGMPRYINEIAWEAKYFCKTYWDGEFHPGFTPDFENICVWIGTPENEPPRVVSKKECIENNYGIIKGAAICLPGMVLARAGRLLLPYIKELAEKCLATAKDVYDRVNKMKTSNLYYKESGLLQIDLEFYQIYKDEKYIKDAEQRVKNILELQDKDGNFYTDNSKTSKTIRAGMHLPALYEFVKQNPESILFPEIKKAFKLWADYNMQFANLSPFGQIGGTEKDGTLRNIVPHTNNSKLANVAWALATTAILLEDTKYLEAAENQIQWVVGFNPADISMMAGLGKGPGCHHTRYAFMEGCENAIIPGGIKIGIHSGTGELMELGDITKNFIITEVPIDYPVIDTGTWGWTYAYKTSEYACSKNGMFLMGVSQIAKALRMLK